VRRRGVGPQAHGVAHDGAVGFQLLDAVGFADELDLRDIVLFGEAGGDGGGEGAAGAVGFGPFAKGGCEFFHAVAGGKDIGGGGGLEMAAFEQEGAIVELEQGIYFQDLPPGAFLIPLLLGDKWPKEGFF
jgi:hypothetical protein